MKINKESILEYLLDNKNWFLNGSILFLTMALSNIYLDKDFSIEFYLPFIKFHLIVSLVFIVIYKYLLYYEKKHYPKE